ncbi:hypothetical protein [Desulfuromonas sp. AOP6]|uniref:hypothetical protein n=1 Tax=Desulfuromonas sp. AOP6 TaxID=1566351 RepID=UPI0012775A1C|nr:hypothetical protein [Desulfuromonas sp. AOP6]BCA78702.1 hypothetical protein AOP6_0489 [Desulfuromonas sp. AOP6]
MKRDTHIACQQILQEDSSVFSMQQLDLPAALARDLNVEALFERYLQHIRRFTLGLIRPTRQQNQVLFRLAGTRLSLLIFNGPSASMQGAEHILTLAICGGLLVQPQSCDRGELVFSCEAQAESLRLTLRLADYCPLLLGSQQPTWWRKGLYRFTQATIHKTVTRRFFARLYRERAGKGACCRVVQGRWRQGEDI